MISRKTYLFVFLFVVLVAMFFVNLAMGSLSIPVSEVFSVLFQGEASKPSWEYIVLGFRFPKAIVAILTGISLPIAGMLMQSLFRNPMAEPYVLGLSSGASLGVALVVLGAGFLPLGIQQYVTSPYSLVLASVAGSFTVLFGVLLAINKVRSTATLLIVGLMFSSFSGALVGVLSYFSTAEDLKRFTFWAMGSLSNHSWQDIFILFITTLVGLAICLVLTKSLNTLMLGETYAQTIGVNIKKTRYQIIIATGILTGSVTAFVGPIAFIGLAVPHISRIIFKTSNHFVLFFANMIIGAIVLLVSDVLSQIPGSSIILPINAVTSIIGAPIVISMLLKQKNV
ncbi:MAG TPA: iron ABC transporter permease [Flavobacterium sp.]|nr:iron ABC transporter permease [Flavobacterium sp.]